MLRHLMIDRISSYGSSPARSPSPHSSNSTLSSESLSSCTSSASLDNHVSRDYTRKPSSPLSKEIDRLSRSPPSSVHSCDTTHKKTQPSTQLDESQSYVYQLRNSAPLDFEGDPLNHKQVRRLSLPRPTQQRRKPQSGNLNSSIRHSISSFLHTDPPQPQSFPCRKALDTESLKTPRRGWTSRLDYTRVLPREDEGREPLPPYTCSVYKVATVMRKLELLHPLVPAPTRKWIKVIIELNNTALIVRCAYSGKLIRKYSLQYGDVGLASDYTKHKQVLRLRLESEQFLFSVDTPIDCIMWYHAIQAGINLSLPLDERRVPKVRTIPRRSMRNQTPLSASRRDLSRPVSVLNNLASTWSLRPMSSRNAPCDHQSGSRRDSVILNRFRKLWESTPPASHRIASVYLPTERTANPRRPHSVYTCTSLGFTQINEDLEDPEQYPDHADMDDFFNEPESGSCVSTKWFPTHRALTEANFIRYAYRCLSNLPASTSWEGKWMLYDGEFIIFRKADTAACSFFF